MWYKEWGAQYSFPTDLSRGVVVISIEPSPDNSPDPFAFKPLGGHIPANAKDHKTYEMTDNVGGVMLLS